MLPLQRFEMYTWVTCISHPYSVVLNPPEGTIQSQEQAIESISPLCRHCEDLARTARLAKAICVEEASTELSHSQDQKAYGLMLWVPPRFTHIPNCPLPKPYLLAGCDCQ